MTSRCRGLGWLETVSSSKGYFYRKHGFLNTRFSVKSIFEYGLFLFTGIFKARVEALGFLTASDDLLLPLGESGHRITFGCLHDHHFLPVFL